MKKMSVVLGLLLAVLVMGCGIYESYGFDYKQLSSIERGMSFKEVCTILGEPAFRDLNKEGEAWTFRAYTPAGWSAVKVWFKDGKVDEMKSYLVVTAFSPFYPLVTNSLSTTSDFCLSPLFIGRDKNGTKPENKISKNTFEPIKSLRHIVLSGAKFLQTSAMKTCFQIAECS